MTGVDKTQRLLAQIRAAISARSDKARQSGAASSASTAADAPGSDQPVPLFDSLKAEIRSLDLQTEAGLKKGRRVFVQVVLLDEFGLALANDPRFAEVVDKVEAVISEQDALRSDLDEVLAEIAGH